MTLKKKLYRRTQIVSETEKKTGWRWGVNRWILLAIIIIGANLTGKFLPARPAIFLPAEALFGNAEHPLFMIGSNPFYITNTLVATILADLFLILVAFFAIRSFYKKGGLKAPKGVAGFFEGLSEVIYNLTENTAGKWTKTIFPWFAAISILVLTMNWMELIPGVDSIGIFDTSHVTHAAVAGMDESDTHAIEIAEEEALNHYYKVCETSTFEIGNTEVVSVWVNPDYKEEGTAKCAHAIVPFVRAAATDLNFTVGLALISVVMIQVIGVKALGLKYFEKFIYVRTLFTKPFFGLIDFAVGLFEVVSEFSKIISFSFRLFGNVFAGAVLLFVLGTLIPVLAQSLVLIMEFGVGLIQAIVFGMLTMVFMAQATQAHHGDEH
jgi:F-type H+-transporting ATPase subunit a